MIIRQKDSIVQIYLDTCCLNRPLDEQTTGENQFENGYGDYTEEREALLHDVTIDDITASIAERKIKK